MDRGWSWVVMVACFFSLILAGLLVYSVGVIHVALLETYRQDNAKTAWVGAIHSSLLMFAGPVSGAVVGRLGCRVTMFIGGLTILLGCSLSAFVNSVDALMVTYGLIGGVGLSLVYLPSVVAVGYHFEHYRALASGVAQAGAALGLFAGGPLTRMLLDTYGLHGTFLMFGAIGFHNCLFAMFLRPSGLERRIRLLETQARRRHALSHGAPSLGQRLKEIPSSYLAMLRNYSFLCYTVSILFFNVGYAAVVLHLPGYAESLGTSSSDAAALFTGVGVGSLVARLLPGMLITNSGNRTTEKVHREKNTLERDDVSTPPSQPFDGLIMHISGLGIAGVTTVLFPSYSSGYSGQIVFACLFGLYSSIPIGLYTPLTVELVGIDRLAIAYGFETLMMGIGYGLGPPIAGLIVDNGGTYEHSFIFSGTALLLASLIGFLTCSLRARYKPQAPALTAGEVTVEVTAVGSVGFLPVAGSLSFLSSTASLHVCSVNADGLLGQLENGSLRLDTSSLGTRSFSRRLDSSALRLDGLTGSITLHGEPIVITNVEEIKDFIPNGVTSLEHDESD